MIIVIYFYNFYYQSNSVYKQQFHLIFADGPPWIIIGAAAGGGAVSVIAIIVLLICCLRRDKKVSSLNCQPRLSLHREAQLTKRYNNLALKNTWLQTYHKRLQNPLTNFKSSLVVISSFKSERKLFVLVQIAAANVFSYLFILIVLSTCLRDVLLHDLEGGSDAL